MSEWISVKDRLPKPEVKVIAFYFNSLGKPRQVMAFYAPKFTIESTTWDSYGDEGIDEYDEKTDTYWLCEGWWECIDNWDDYTHIKIYQGEVIEWQPLPTRTTGAEP